ncbi:MAG: hypothetical protein IJX16_05820 [Clostridia bacterium]|nr:hypothetical protein [Clostridia bacterium]
MQEFKQAKKRKWWFRLLKKMMNGRYKKPLFVYIEKEFPDGSVILSNHEGTDSPMSIEKYLNRSVRMWGTHEMNSGLVKMYKYQTRVYYHEKKHWNLHLARLFCLLASPLTNLFYSGFDLISTYRDHRFMKTVKESLSTIKNGDSIMIFPEDSTNGYLPELEGFFAGFASFCEYALKNGIDVPVVVSYFKKEEKIYIFDKPIYYSELKKDGKTKEEIADKLLKRCNELGKMTFDEETVEKAKAGDNKLII